MVHEVSHRPAGLLLPEQRGTNLLASTGSTCPYLTLVPWQLLSAGKLQLTQ